MLSYPCYAQCEHTVIVNNNTTKIIKLLAPVKKRLLAFEFLFCSHDHLERHVTFPSHRLSQQQFATFTAQITGLK